MRAVARKSTSSKIPVRSLPEFSSLTLSGDSVGINSEHKGRTIYRLNENYQDVPFEPHQCGATCVENHPYIEDNFESKPNHHSFALFLLFLNFISFLNYVMCKCVLIMGLNKFCQ